MPPKRFEIMENLYASKTFLKMAGGSWDAYPSSYPPVISYRNHQKSLAYFSHLAPLNLFFFTKMQGQKGGHGPMPPPPPLNTLLALSIVTALTACHFSIKKCAKISFLCENRKNLLGAGDFTSKLSVVPPPPFCQILDTPLSQGYCIVLRF